MGWGCPPYYKKDTPNDIINAIADIDVKINELFIVREKYVADLTKAIEEKNSTEA